MRITPPRPALALAAGRGPGAPPICVSRAITAVYVEEYKAKYQRVRDRKEARHHRWHLQFGLHAGVRKSCR